VGAYREDGRPSSEQYHSSCSHAWQHLGVWRYAFNWYVVIACTDCALDLSPLSYIAGTLIGNPSIRVYHSPADGSPRRLAPSSKALPEHGIAPLALQSKEHLGILNGTAFSAATAALVLHDAAHLALLAQACTALGTEALLGTRASYDPFIHAVARPHPGQVEAADAIYRLLEGSKFAEDHEEEVALTDDKGTLRQDRYPLRTAPQYLGPQLEDILSALETVTQECNSSKRDFSPVS
jgi:phenylalanine ammonia-lyase